MRNVAVYLVGQVLLWCVRLICTVALVGDFVATHAVWVSSRNRQEVTKKALAGVTADDASALCGAYGVVWSVRELRHFLDGNRFLIRTYHQALSWIYSTTDASGRLMRWCLRLSEYTFDIQYKPGASHHSPDFMSRTDNDAAVE